MPSRIVSGAAGRPAVARTLQSAAHPRVPLLAGGSQGEWRRSPDRRYARAAWGAVLALLLAGLALPAAAATRTLFLRGETNAVGVETTLTVLLAAQGDENAVGFSLNFATNELAFVSAAPGTNALGAAELTNTNAAGAGRVGFALALPAGQRFSAGTNELLRVRFLPLRVANAVVAFGDAPVTSEVADTNATALTTVYSNSVVVITAMIPPGIATQPTNRTVYAGTNVTMSLVATGSLPLVFQWWKDGSAVPGATGASLMLSNVAVSQSGSYQAIVSNPGGSATSAVAVLTVLPAPVAPSIVQPPVGRAVTVGETVSFSVTAEGTAPLGYQWRLGGTALLGRTNATLVLTNVQTSQAGSYTVVVSNLAGTVTSAAATLTVSAAPRVVRVVSQLAGVGGIVEVPVELSALGEESAVGFSLEFDPARLWFTGASPGTGVPGGQLQLNTSQAGAGRVGVAVATGFGQALAAGVRELVRVRFQVVGGLGVANVGLGDTPIWREVADVYGEARPASSSNGTVTVVGPPVILLQPQSQTVPVLGNMTLSVTATGAPPISYQWRWKGTNLTGAAGAQLTLTNIQSSQGGTYSVMVSNVGGVRVSADAEIKIARVVSVECPTVLLGQTTNAVVKLLAGGDENAVGFSLRFDPTRLRFIAWQPGLDTTNASFNVNTNEAGAGLIGVAVAMPGLNSMPGGLRQILLVRLGAIQPVWETSLSFTDTPVVRELADGSAEPLPSAFVSTTLAVEPALRIDTQGRVFLRGPTNGVYALASTTNLLGHWVELSPPVLSNSIQQVAGPETNLPSRFYRARWQ